MRLYVVRHGKAERDSASGRDHDRELTELGRRQSQWLGRSLASDPPGAILASPAVRARDTAAIIHEELRKAGVERSLVVEPRLQVGVSASSLIELIRSTGPAPSLMLVGHNPTLGELVWALERGLPPSEVELRTGQAYILEANPTRPIGTASILDVLRLAAE